MGSDNAALYSDDTASDVRDSYRDALAQGMSDQDSEEAVLNQFADELLDEDERVIVWLALAHSQSMLGRLSPRVRAQALDLLKKDGDLARWRESGANAVRLRAQALAEVRQQIEGPQPGRKRVRRPRSVTTTVTPGEVLGYRAVSGRLHLLWVVAIADESNIEAPVVWLLDYADVERPEPADMTVLVPRVRDRYRWTDVDFLILERSGERPSDHSIETVGSLPPPQDGIGLPSNMVGWDAMVRYIEQRDANLETG